MEGKDQSGKGLGDGLSDLLARLSLRERATLGAMADGNFAGDIEVENVEGSSHGETTPAAPMAQASNEADVGETSNGSDDGTASTDGDTTYNEQIPRPPRPHPAAEDNEPVPKKLRKETSTSPTNTSTQNAAPSSQPSQTQPSPFFELNAYSATDRWRFKQFSNLNGCRGKIQKALRQAGAQGPIMNVKLERLDGAMGRMSVQEVFDLIENESCLVRAGGVRELSVKVVME